MEEKNTARKRIIVTACVLGVVAVVVPFLDIYTQTLVTEILIFGILAMSLDILLGFSGMASLGHGAYFGVSAYAAAIFMTKSDWTWTYNLYNWSAAHGLGVIFLFVTCLLVAAAFSAFFGYLAIRATGVYFLMITLSLAMVIWGLAYRWSAVTGGDNGIIVPGRPTLFGISIDGEMAFFYFTFGVFAICMGLLYLIVRSPFGKSLVGIRERSTRMEMLGYNVWLHRYMAFMISGTFGGVAGILWALFRLFVSPPDVELITSAECLFMVALGGPATLVGPVIGSAIIRTLQQFVSIYIARWPLILGSIYIITIMLGRLYGVEGIIGLFNKLRTKATEEAAGARAKATGEAASAKG